MGRVHRHMNMAHGEDKEVMAQRKRKAKMAAGGSGMGRPRKKTIKAPVGQQPQVMIPQQPIEIMQQQQQQPQQQQQVIDPQEQDAAVQYLQQQLEGPHGTVITVTPLYQQ